MEQAWRDELFEWLRIPSVSADPARRDDVRRAGAWLRDFIRRAGGDAELVETRAQPLVVGELRASNGSESAPTVLAYGHFDVQPPEPLDLWESPPFEPVIRGEWLYGRGVADDKGQLYLLLKAAADLAAEGALPVNVRIVSDGEEETGGTTIVDWIHADERGADACVIFDGGIERRDRPQLCTGTRGVIAFNVSVSSGGRDLHSGMYGNAALNAIHALNDTLAALLPRNGRLPEPLRQGLEPVSDVERRSWQELPAGDEYLERAGARPYDERAAEEFWLRTTAEPSIDVNGILGGKPGLRNTTVPVAAQANFTIRVAAGQDVDTVASAAERLMREAAPAGAELQIDYEGTPAGYVAPDAPALELAAGVFERVWGAPTLRARLGGTLPIFPALADRGIPCVLTGIALPESNVHSPNERLLLELAPLGYRAARDLFVSFAALRS